MKLIKNLRMARQKVCKQGMFDIKVNVPVIILENVKHCGGRPELADTARNIMSLMSDVTHQDKHPHTCTIHSQGAGVERGRATNRLQHWQCGGIMPDMPMKLKKGIKLVHSIEQSQASIFNSTLCSCSLSSQSF